MGMTPVVFSKATISTPGVEARQPGRTEFRQALEEAHAVVSSAGSQLISECLLSNILSLFFIRIKMQSRD